MNPSAAEIVREYGPFPGVDRVRGVTYDGRYAWMAAGDKLVAFDPAPGGGGDSGLAWAEGTLWVGQYRNRKIHQVDPQTGEILRTIEPNRFVTGVTWVDGELWHATWEGDESDVRRVDPGTGEVLERIEMPPGVNVSGLESDGGGSSGKVRTIRRPGRSAAADNGSAIPGDSVGK
jgi:outer membrane protein assembly factor BamB